MILFYRKTKKKTRNGLVPIYVRVTIDALSSEMSTGLKLDPGHWDESAKCALEETPDDKSINKRLRQIQTDLERTFDLIQSRQEVATAEAMLNAYRTPVKADQRKEERAKNLELNEAVDDLTLRYVAFFNSWDTAHNSRSYPKPEKIDRLQRQKKDLDAQIKAMAQAASVVFDSPSWEKTVMLALAENLRHYLLLVMAGQQAYPTLEKIMGRKKRYLEFMGFTYKKADLALTDLQFSFLYKLVSYNIVHHSVDQKTAIKYAQHFKEIANRCVSNGWMATNIFVNFKCPYIEPHHDWLIMGVIHRSNTCGFRRKDA